MTAAEGVSAPVEDSPGGIARRLGQVVDRLDLAIRRFDDDPRVIALGVLAGLALAALMAANVDRDVPRLAWAAVGLALAAPTAAVSMLATVVVLREPYGLSPLHFHAMVVAAAAFSTLFRFGIRAAAGERLAARPAFLAVGAYAGLSALQFVSVAFKVSRDRGLFAQGTLTEVLSGLTLVVLVAVLFTPRSRGYLVAAIVPGIVVAAGLAILSLSPELVGALPIKGWLPAQDISARGTGLFRNPNYLGQAMAIGFILVARGRSMSLPGPLTRWAPLLASVVALGLIVSFSRGALIAVAAGVVVLYAVRGRRALALAGAAAVAFVVVGYQVVLAVRHLLTFGAHIDLSGAAQAASDEARLSVYVAGVKLFLQHPLLGVGYAQFHYASVRYLDQNAVTYPHNVFLGVAAEQGIPGITLLLVMLVALGVQLWRIRDPFAITGLAMLAAFVAGSLLADNLSSLQTVGMLWIAVGAALVSRPNPGPVAAPPNLADPSEVRWASAPALRGERWRPRQP